MVMDVKPDKEMKAQLKMDIFKSLERLKKTVTKLEDQYWDLSDRLYEIGADFDE